MIALPLVLLLASQAPMPKEAPDNLDLKASWGRVQLLSDGNGQAPGLVTFSTPSGPRMVEVPPGTPILDTQGRRVGGLGQLSLGEEIRVFFTLDSTGRGMAREIDRLPPPKPARPPWR